MKFQDEISSKSFTVYCHDLVSGTVYIWFFSLIYSLFMYLLTLKTSSRQKLRILKSEQMDHQANLKLSSFLHMLESHYLKSLIINLLGITQLPVTAKELWIAFEILQSNTQQMHCLQEKILLKIKIHCLMLLATKPKFTSLQ